MHILIHPGSRGTRIAAIITLWMLLSPIPWMRVQAQNIVTYTTDADFDRGSMQSVNHRAVADQLQLDQGMDPLPMVNVAASDRGTIVRIDANTGRILGEYRSAPESQPTNPSRTTVDRAGNVWAANRNAPFFGEDSGTVICIGVVVGGTRCNSAGAPDPNGGYLKPPFDYITARDRDGDGLIRTSMGLGDILAWNGQGSVLAAEDECILHFIRVPALNCRHVSVDGENNIWVGGYSISGPGRATMLKINGQTGERMIVREGVLCGGYGGLVSRLGYVYSASLDGGGGPLLRMTATGATYCIDGVDAYGLAEDAQGAIWATEHATGLLYKLSPDGALLNDFPVSLEGDWPRGVAVTKSDNHIWIACSGSHTVERRDSDGRLIHLFSLDRNDPGGFFPTGVAVDINGKVWVTNMQSNNVFRIDPQANGGSGEVDLVVDLGLGAGPYNYSDMTGVALGSSLPYFGRWSVVHTAGTAVCGWERIVWNARLDGDARLHVRARSADNAQELAQASFRDIDNGVVLCGGDLPGRMIEVVVEFHRGSSATNNPVLLDLSMYPRPCAEITGPSELCAGDSVALVAAAGFASCTWLTPDGQRSGDTLMVRTPGEYIAILRSASGCVDSVRHTVVQRDAPIPDVAGDRSFWPGSSTTLELRSAHSACSWSNAAGQLLGTDRVVVISDTGWFRLWMRDAYGCIGTLDLHITHRDTADCVVGFKHYTASPGERVRLPLLLLSRNGDFPAGEQRFTTEVRLDRRVVAPLVFPGLCAVDGEEYVLRMDSVYSGIGDTLAVLQGVATLGTQPFTALHVRAFAWSNPGVRVRKEDGSLRLAICEEGGNRLFDGTVRFSLSPPYPSPFNASTILRYSVSERQHVTLRVFDVHGRCVATLVDGEHEAGSHEARFDAGGLASGTYHAILVGGMQRQQVRLLLLK